LLSQAVIEVVENGDQDLAVTVREVLKYTHTAHCFSYNLTVSLKDDF
jgi:hypothetical protein